MTTELYTILLTVSGTIILILVSIIITSSTSRFKKLDDLLSKVNKIETMLSERHTFSNTRHLRIDKKLLDHCTMLAKHSEEITTLKAKIL